jgi:hypothetical protein
MGPRGFGKTLKCFQRFMRRSDQYDLNPLFFMKNGLFFMATDYNYL